VATHIESEITRGMGAALAVEPVRGENWPVLCAVAGLGYYLPEQVVTNAHLAQTVDTSNEWIIERTGIQGRHKAAPNEATSDLAHRAAVDALADAGLTGADLDLILLATSTPDTPVPATACYLQERLGCIGVASMDVSAGCAGFGYALHMAAAAVKSGMHKRVMVVGVDCLTRITNYADRQSCILFGDGAGAAVVGTSGFMDVVYSNLGADGSAAHLVQVPAGGSREPASAETVAGARHTLILHGRDVFRAAVRQMCDSIRRAAVALGINVSDFDLVVPHQANARIIEAVGSQLDVPVEKLVVDIEETGNTAAASIPIALGRARQRGKLDGERLIVTVGFGAGTAWACQVLRTRPRS